MAKELERLKEGPKVEIHIDLLRTTLKILDWKTPGDDGIHGFWFKKFTSIYDRRALEMKNAYKKQTYPSGWSKERPHCSKKTPFKGTAPNNYRPITCLPMMWRILTAQIREDIYFSLTNHGLFLKEQKGWCKGSRGTGELLYIDQHILNEGKARRENLAMAWIDYKNAYAMVLQSWIINCFKM